MSIRAATVDEVAFGRSSETESAEERGEEGVGPGASRFSVLIFSADFCDSGAGTVQKFGTVRQKSIEPWSRCIFSPTLQSVRNS